MSVIIILMLCSIILAGGFLLAFIWASKTGQFEDDISPAHRILFDQNKKLKNK